MSDVTKDTRDIREVEFVHHSMIESTNSKLDEAVVNSIVKEGWRVERGLALPAYHVGSKFIITDGNHRLEALKRLGESLVPIVRISKEEYDYVKYSDRHVDFFCKFPEKPKIWVPRGYIHYA